MEDKMEKLLVSFYLQSVMMLKILKKWWVTAEDAQFPSKRLKQIKKWRNLHIILSSRSALNGVAPSVTAKTCPKEKSKLDIYLRLMKLAEPYHLSLVKIPKPPKTYRKILNP